MFEPSNNTIVTYEKVSKLALKRKTKDENILDFGAGIGLGADKLREDFINVETYEPNPLPLIRWKSNIPVTYTALPNKKYDIICCLNVLNVVREYERSLIIRQIISLIKENGYIYFSYRRSHPKRSIHGPEPDSYYTIKNRNFHKRFNKKTFIDYISIFGLKGEYHDRILETTRQ